MAWTNITNAAVAAGAAVTTALMTALRDNSKAIFDANKAFPQQFVLTGSGTLTLTDLLTPIPDDAIVVIEMWGAGGGGSKETNTSTSGVTSGGGGGAYMRIVTPKKYFPDGKAYSIGAGGVGRTTSSSGVDGGDTTWNGLIAAGGGGGNRLTSSDPSESISAPAATNNYSGAPNVTFELAPDSFVGIAGGRGGSSGETSVGDGESTVLSGAGGGAAKRAGTDAESVGGTSVYGGDGGDGSLNSNGGDGVFPAGGGGSVNGSGNGGNGADGSIVVTIYAMGIEEA